MITPTVELQYENTDAGKVYYLKVTSNFSGPNYVANGSTVIQTPTTLGGDLIVNLYVQTSSEGVNPIVQEVEIGTFPRQIASWVLTATILDQDETVVGQASEAQDEEDAHER